MSDADDFDDLTVEAEIAALEVMCREFDAFNERTARRVLWYLTDRYVTHRKSPQPPKETGR